MSQKSKEKNDKEQSKKPGVVTSAYIQMKKWLLEGLWGPGEPLPKEEDLRLLLGGDEKISRWSVREVLFRLRRVGAIETIDGHGSRISGDFAPHMLRDDPNFVIWLSREEFSDMHEFRQNVELGCVELAARRATAEDIAVIEQALRDMKKNKHHYVAYSRAENEFHFAIMNATHNKIFIKAMNAVKGEYHAYLEELNKKEMSDVSLKAHVELFNAIELKNTVAAVQAMEKIIACTISTEGEAEQRSES